MRQVLDTGFRTDDLSDAWQMDRRKTTAAMVKFRQQWKAILRAWGPLDNAHNAKKCYRAFHRKLRLLLEHDAEQFDEFTRRLLRGQ